MLWIAKYVFLDQWLFSATATADTDVAVDPVVGDTDHPSTGRISG